MKSVHFLKRGVRFLALAAVFVNVLAFSAGADDTDTDSDSMPDSWENTYGFDPADPTDATTDADGDGLTNGSEYSRGTNPLNTDSDADGRSDGDEVSAGTDPAVYEAADMDILDISIDATTGVVSYAATNLGNLSVDYTIDAGYTGVYMNYGEADETLYYYDWNAEMGAGTWVGTFFMAGGSETINTGLTLASGEHSVMVCIDRAAMHGEMASGLDNCEIETFRVGTDLTVNDITTTPTGTPGEFYVYTTLANGGDLNVMETSGVISAALNGTTLQTNDWATLDSSLLGFLSVGGVTSGFDVYGISLELENGDVLEVCIDSTDLVSELDESNNCLTQTYDDGTSPDLTIGSVSFNSADSSVDFVVNNAGTGDVQSEAAPDLNFYYDFTDSTLSSSTALSYSINDYGTDYKTAAGTNTVNSGALDTGSASCRMYILAVVDGSGEVAESDEFNNEYRATLDLCPEDGVDENAFTVYAGDDESWEIGPVYSLEDAYAQGAESLSYTTVNWGDGTTTESLTQNLVGEQFELSGTHSYTADGYYEITVCANDGSQELCDVKVLQVAPIPFGLSGTSTGGGAPHDDDGEDPDVILTGDETDIFDCSAMLFSDVSEGDNFYDAVCALWAADVIHGKTSTFFDADDVIRRDEAAKIFTRLFGYVTEDYGDTPDVEESSFVDVSAEDVLSYYIEVASEENIMDSYMEGDDMYFMPHDAMTTDAIEDSMEALGEDELDLSEEGDTMTRGSFVEFLYELVR